MTWHVEADGAWRRAPAATFNCCSLGHAGSQVLTAQLGAEQPAWLAYEALVNRLHTEREEQLYNLGYEHGRAAGRLEALAQCRGEAGRKVRQLAQRLQQAGINAGLPRERVVAALLAAAWSLVLGARSEGPLTRGQHRM